MTQTDVHDVLDAALAATRGQGREDLAARLRARRDRLDDPAVRVLVVGEFKQGKSQLVNALINAPLCAVDDDIATAVPTAVMYGAEPSAAVLLPAPSAVGDGSVGADGGTVDAVPVPLADLGAALSGEAVVDGADPLDPDRRRPVGAEIRVPSDLLREGLVLVDTPGIGGAGVAHSAATLAALPSADAVLMVSDAAQEYSRPELEFLQHAAALCPTVAAVLTKTDLYPAWRRVAQLNRGHLDAAGLGAPLIEVSSTLRLAAARRADRYLNAESGYPRLMAFLRTEVLGRSALLARAAVAHDVESVLSQLMIALETELATLEDPLRSVTAFTELEEARMQTDDLRRRSSRWSQTLADGITDLSADIEHDIRDKMRALAREAEDHVDTVDPAEQWIEFSEWLSGRVLEVVRTNFVWAQERCDWLAEQVAQHFAESAAAALPELRGVETESVFSAVPDLAGIDDGRIGLGQKVLTGMRGSYSGTLMTGLVTSVVGGMALVNPISLTVGVVLGGKAYRDDKKARLKRRQAEAKTVVRRHLDDVVFQISKSSRDELRVSQRVLRDHFTELADQMHRSILEALRAAQIADKRSSVDRDRRVRDIKPAIKAIDAVRRRARALLVAPAGATASTGAPATEAPVPA